MKKVATSVAASAAPEPSRLDEYTLQGVVLAFVSAAFAEIVFSNFLLSAEYLSSIGRVAILFLSLYTIHRFSLLVLSEYKPKLGDLWTLIFIICGSVLVVWLGRLVAISLFAQAKIWPVASELDPRAAWLAIPYASGALLLQSVLGMHFGLVFALMFSTIIAIYTPGYPFVRCLCFSHSDSSFYESFPFTLTLCNG